MKRALLVLTIFFSVSPYAFTGDIVLDPPPDTYPGGKDVVITGTRDTVTYWFEESLDTSPVTYRYPLELTSLPGEERVYTLHIEGDPEGPYIYRIDRKPPTVPSASVGSGVYGNDLYVTLIYDKGDSIFYSLGSGGTIGYRPWQGEPIHLKRPESWVAEQVLRAYTVDSTGNRSGIAEYRYFLETSGGEKDTALTIHSPIEGRFANRQLLYIDHSGYEWIRYSTDGRNPIDRGIEYTGPVILDARGEVLVTVAAKPSGKETPVEKSVSFFVHGDDTGSGLTPDAGLYSRSLSIDPPKRGEYRYTLSEESPRSWDFPFTGSIDLEAFDDVRKIYTLRYRDFSAPDSPEYRKVYVLDKIVPPAPRIAVFAKSSGLSGGAAGDEKAVSFDVVILGSPDIDIFYTIDGTDPDRYAAEYTGPFVLSGKKAASGFDIRAVALSEQGIPSGITGYTGGAGVLTPRRPDPLPLDDGTGFRLDSDDTNVRYVFTLSDSPDFTPPAPDANAPMCSDIFRYHVPYGMERELRVRFAAVNDAGLVSPPTEVFTLRVDRNPPADPRIVFEEGKLIMTGSGTIYYSLSGEEESHLPADLAGDVYTGPLLLEGVTGKLVRYTVSARAVDDAGNSSGTTGPLGITVDLRTPEVPKIRGIRDGETVSREAVVLKWEARHPDSIILYTLATGTDIPDEPVASSNRASDWSIELPAAAGEAVTYSVRYRAMLPGGKTLSPIGSISFTIDREPPRVPVPAGLTGDDAFSYGPLIDVELREAGTEYFVGIGTGSEDAPDCFGPGGRSLDEPFVLDVPEGSEKQYILRFAARDAGGNTVYNDTLYRLAIDRKPPAAPKPFTENLVYSSGDISIPNPDDGTVYLYAFGDLSRARNADAGFQPIEGQLSLNADRGQTEEYIISLKARDRAGNISAETSVYRLIVDKDPPPECSLQYSLTEKGDGDFLLEWYGRGENDLYYSFREEGEYARYTGPVVLPGQDISGLTSGREIFVYLEDPAGNRGETTRIVLVDSPLELPAPRITGVENGGVYAGGVTVEVEAAHGMSRYELSEGTSVRPVTPYSPRLDTPLSVDVVPGETKTYTLTVKSYLSADDGAGGPESAVRFTIDTTPPDPPEIRGAEPGGYYQDSLEIDLSAPEGRIYFSVEPPFPEGGKRGEETGEYTLYEGPMTFAADDSGSARYRISAYTMDEAGNRSLVERKLEFFIDTAILYVSREDGSDSYDGTRDRPFESLEEALSYPMEGNRRTVFVSEGRYEADSSIRLTDGSSLIGGFSHGSWTRTGKTRIVPGEYFSSGSPVIEVTGSGTLENIILEDPAGLSGNLIRIAEGSLEIFGCALRTESAYTGTAVLLDRGELTGRGLDIDLGADGDETGILLKGESSLELAESNIVNTSESGNGIKTMIRSGKGGNITLSIGSVFPGVGRETRGIDLTESSLRMRAVDLRSGRGSAEAAGIRASDSKVQLDSCTLSGDAESTLSFAVKSIDSTLIIKDSLVRLGGRIGATGVYGSGGSAAIEDSTFDNGDAGDNGGGLGSDFISPLKFESITGHVFNSIFESETEVDYIAVDLSSSAVDFYNNTCILSLRSPRSSALRIRNDRGSSIINNIFAGSSSDTSRAFTADSITPGDTEIRNNCFSGWTIIGQSDGEIVEGAEALNRIDGRPRSGGIDGNFTEPYERIFKVSKGSGYELLNSSACVDSGLDLSDRGGPRADRAGRKRPGPDSSRGDTWDLGAFESY